MAAPDSVAGGDGAGIYGLRVEHIESGSLPTGGTKVTSAVNMWSAMNCRDLMEAMEVLQ
jgi:hypothetical protein